MQLTVKFANPAKEGKKYGSIVGQDNNRYPCPASMVARFVKGQTYDVTIEDKKWGDGPPVQVITGVSGGEAAQPAKAPQANGDKWWLAFCSNQVAHAIAAGHITTPDQIKPWAAAAKQAIVEVDGPVVSRKPNFDDLDDGPQF